MLDKHIKTFTLIYNLDNNDTKEQIYENFNITDKQKINKIYNSKFNLSYYYTVDIDKKFNKVYLMIFIDNEDDFYFQFKFVAGLYYYHLINSI